jgi:hypothetical protein
MRHNLLENTLSLVGGAGLGAALMYLFDPDLGSERRQDVRDTAGDALASTGQALKGTMHTARDTARSVAGKISQYAHNLADDVCTSASHDALSAMDSARDVAGSVGGAALGHLSSAGKRARRASGSLSNRATSLWSRAGDEAGIETSHPYARATSITARTIGVLALGAGLMYFMDPDRGRGRRAWASDKILSVSRRTGRRARSYGRHLRNELQGATHQAQPWTSDNWFGGGGGRGEQGSTSEVSMPSAGAGEPYSRLM